MIFTCFLATSWPRCFFEVGPQLKIDRNSIWVLPNFKKYAKQLFWPTFGQKTSKFQLRSLFYRHDNTKMINDLDSEKPYKNFAFYKDPCCYTFIMGADEVKKEHFANDFAFGKDICCNSGILLKFYESIF